MTLGRHLSEEQIIEIAESRGMIVLSRRRARAWCDGKLKEAVLLGMWNDLGAGYGITVTKTGHSTRVYEPCSFKVRAEYISGVSYENQVPVKRRFKVYEFEFKAENMTVLAIVEGTRKGVKNAIESSYEVD